MPASQSPIYIQSHKKHCAGFHKHYIAKASSKIIEKRLFSFQVIGLVTKKIYTPYAVCIRNDRPHPLSCPPIEDGLPS